MQIELCSDKKSWDNFILQNSNSFLQSFDWGEFQQKFGKKIFRIRVSNNEQILAQAQIIKNKFVFKNYFYIPYGPIIASDLIEQQKKEAVSALINKIKELAKTENCFFVQIEPFSDISFAIKKYSAPIKRMQPKKTLILDLSPTEDELFKNFSRTTKYNIGLAQRKGVIIKKEKAYSDDFFNLMTQTKERQEFGIHAEKYYRNMLQLQGESLKTELFFAEKEGKKICGTLMTFFGDTAVTLHAGSDYQYRQIKGPNLLEWEIIKATKLAGFKKLDFWGIDEKKWPGLTAFKKGFNGIELEYPDGADIVFESFWYKLYKIIKAIKSKI